MQFLNVCASQPPYGATCRSLNAPRNCLCTLWRRQGHAEVHTAGLCIHTCRTPVRVVDRDSAVPDWRLLHGRAIEAHCSNQGCCVSGLAVHNQAVTAQLLLRQNCCMEDRFAFGPAASFACRKQLIAHALYQFCNVCCRSMDANSFRPDFVSFNHRAKALPINIPAIFS